MTVKVGAQDFPAAPSAAILYDNASPNPPVSPNLPQRQPPMPRPLILLVLLVLAVPAAADHHGDHSDKLKALIIDGQNNHVDWPKTTIMMRDYLEDSGRFEVDIARTQFTWKGEKWMDKFPLGDGVEYENLDKPKTDPDFAPEFANYDVVISNFGWNAAPWPDATKQSFNDYVRGGGGLVIIHAADNSFGDWEAFNEMIGLGGWGGRNEKSGPYVYYKDDQLVRDTSKGNGGAHGPQREFQVVTRDPDHPVMKGLPNVWMHTRDELYQQLRGPANHMTVLATSYADETKGGSGRHEPTILTIDYGDGRVFHTPLGHADYSFESVGFQTILLRGTEWAATGKVTIEPPKDFPTAEKSSSRNYEPAAVAN